MVFEKHLFISYAHLDNLKTPDDDQGWVTRFHESLEAWLSHNMGQTAHVWRDDSLQGLNEFTDEIVQQFSHTAIMLSVLSPRYVESRWCAREVKEFCECAEANGGLKINNKVRVIRAMLKRLPLETLSGFPEAFSSSLGYEFYKEIEGGRQLPLDPRFGSREDYNRQVYLLAEDIAGLISDLQSKQASGPGPAAKEKKTIYLAECSYDMREEREKLRGELRGQGYCVLPDQATQLPDTEAEYEAEARRLLSQCEVSVHVVGKHPGKILDGPHQVAVVELQNRLAAEQSESRHLPRIIWLPESSRIGAASEYSFPRDLERVGALQRGADLVTAGLDTLKGVLHALLHALEEPQPSSERGFDQARVVHVICDQKDRPATLPLRKFLKSQKIEVSLPVFEGDAATVRRANEEALAQCDAVILFYGAGGEAWKRTVDNDLLRMRSYRSGKPLTANYVYLSAPETDDKRDLIEMEEPNLLLGFEAFQERDLAPLVSKLAAR